MRIEGGERDGVGLDPGVRTGGGEGAAALVDTGGSVKVEGVDPDPDLEKAEVVAVIPLSKQLCSRPGQRHRVITNEWTTKNFMLAGASFSLLKILKSKAIWYNMQ